MTNADPRHITRVRTYTDDLSRARGGHRAAAPTQKPQTVPQRSASTPTQRPSAPLPPPPTSSNTGERATSTPTTPVAQKKPIRATQRDVSPQPDRTQRAEPKKPTAPKHTLPVDVSTVRSPRQSILSDTDDALGSFASSDFENQGTIVTDTKRKRFRLFPAMYAAIKEWLFEKKEDFEESQKPKHTVSSADTRKDIVTQAAGKSALAPRDDYAAVRERLRHVPRTAASRGDVTIRDAQEVPQPAWTHTDDEQPAPANTPPPAASPTPVTSQPTPPPAQPTEPTPKPEPEPEPAPKPEPVPIAPDDQPESPSKPSAPPESVEQQTSSVPPPVTAPRRRSYLIIIAASVFASVLGIGVSVWFFSGTDSTAPSVASVDTGMTFMDSSVKQPVALGRTHDELLSALAAARSAGTQSSIIEFYPTVPVGDGEHSAATRDDVLTVFTPNAPGSFLRSVTAIGFGSYRGAPYVILKVSSFDTALGGILAWESTMTNDLAPFFGPPLDTPGTFVDTVHANRDIRILSDDDGNDRIAYSFLNRTTILISTDRMSIADLAPLIH